MDGGDEIGFCREKTSRSFQMGEVHAQLKEEIR
jgi:hypothetical protein